jgi:hypothetical protein
MTKWAVFRLLLLIVPVRPFECRFSVGSSMYDLTALAGLHTATKENRTPPTTSEARVYIDLCGESGIPREDGVSDEDQVGATSGDQQTS